MFVIDLAGSISGHKYTDYNGYHPSDSRVLSTTTRPARRKKQAINYTGHCTKHQPLIYFVKINLLYLRDITKVKKHYIKR